MLGEAMSAMSIIWDWVKTDTDIDGHWRILTDIDGHCNIFVMTWKWNEKEENKKEEKTHFNVR
jgi:hypothetical protein